MFLVGPAQSVIQGIYTQHFGLKLAELAGIILICRVFDAVTDPAIGFVSDRTRERLPGGRKFLVVFGTAISLISVYYLFVPTQPVTATYFFVWFMLCYLSWTLIEIPHLSWGSELSRDYRDRATVFSYRATFYYLGYAAFLALPFLPVFDSRAYTPETLVAALWLVVALFPITVFAATRLCPQGEGAPEHKKTSVLHAVAALRWNRPLRLFSVVFVMVGLGIGMQTGIAFLWFTSFLGLIEEAPVIFLVSFPMAILGLPVWLAVSKTIGKHFALMLGTLLTAASFVLIGMIRPGPDIFWQIIVLNSAIHFLQSSWIAIGPAMLGDIVDYDQSITGQDNSATYFAFFTFIRKVFEGVGGGIGLYIAATFGFEPSNLVIDERVTLGVQLVMGYVPAVIFVAAAVVAYRSPITASRHKEILAVIADRNERAMRDHADGPGAAPG